jgi:ferredoxin
MSTSERRQRLLEKRPRVQFYSLVVINSYILASVGKYICLPVLNCYACPIGAVACPIGSITAFAMVLDFPFYVIGMLGIAGLALGRAFCGWVCPFGFIQDLLHRIPGRKLQLPRALDATKYVLLVVLVIGLPLLLGNPNDFTGTERVVFESGGTWDYCALVCPVGTLEAGIPGLIASPDFREKASWRTVSKFVILAAVLVLAALSHRSFCRVLCPLGALMAIASIVKLPRLRTDQGACTRCQRCRRTCPTNSRLVPGNAGEREATSECVLCLECVRVCPEAGALSASLAGKSLVTSGGKTSE